MFVYEFIHCGNRCKLLLIICGWLLIFAVRHCHHTDNLIIIVIIGLLVLRLLMITPLFALRTFFLHWEIILLRRGDEVGRSIKRPVFCRLLKRLLQGGWDWIIGQLENIHVWIFVTDQNTILVDFRTIHLGVRCECLLQVSQRLILRLFLWWAEVGIGRNRDGSLAK